MTTTTTLALPFGLFWEWFKDLAHKMRELLSQPMLILVSDHESKLPLHGAKITDIAGPIKAETELTGACRCKGIKQFSLFDRDGRRLLLLQPDGGWDYSLEIPKNTRTLHVTVKLPEQS